MKESTRRILPLMDAALESEIGVEVQVDKLAVFRRTFYRERTANMARYEGLSLLTPPKDGGNKVWIVHKEVALTDVEPQQEDSEDERGT